MEALKRHADLTVQTTQGNRIIPKEQQVRLAKRPNGAQEQSASILDLLSFIGFSISYFSRIVILRLPCQTTALSPQEFNLYLKLGLEKVK